MKTSKELLGTRIREIRKAKGLSQERLAELVGIEPRHVSRIEVGKSYPTISRLEKLSMVLGVTMRDFFDFGHLKSPDEREKDMEIIIKNLPEEHQRIIFKIVRAFRDI